MGLSLLISIVLKARLQPVSISGFNLSEKYTRDITATPRETCLREVTLKMMHNWELPTRTASFTGACRIALSEQ